MEMLPFSEKSLIYDKSDKEMQKRFRQGCLGRVIIDSSLRPLAVRAS